MSDLVGNPECWFSHVKAHLLFQDNIIGTAYTSALYLKSLGFKDKLYVVGNPSMGHELDLCGIKHTGIGVSISVRKFEE